MTNKNKKKKTITLNFMDWETHLRRVDTQS